MTLARIIDAAQLRRGMLVTWTWGQGARARAAAEAGMAPRGRILTRADKPDLATRFTLQVEGDRNWFIDPAAAIRAGRDLFLERAAEPPQVLNAKLVGKSRAGAVYVGRPSAYGNPFSIGKHGDRDAVIEKYIAWLHETPGFVERVRTELAGKDLICWCAPEACHGHILRDIAMGADLPPVPDRGQPDLFPDSG